MKIPVNRPVFTEDDCNAVLDVMKSGWISSEGPSVSNLEQSFASYTQRQFSIAVSNGTVALEIALRALDLKKEDEVILPTFCIVSCIAAVIRVGCRPVFVDSDPTTWNMSLDKIKEKLTKNTKCILAVHTYGLPINMIELQSIATQNNIRVIEDVAEAIGAKVSDKPCGSFGDISTASFYANKHVSSGEGGIITTNDPILNKRIRSLRNLCFGEEDRFKHEELGYNGRITSLQAALALSQLKRIQKTQDIKYELGARYNKNLKECKYIELQPIAHDGNLNSFWVFGVLLNDTSKKTAKETMKLLKDKGIDTRPFFYPMHKQPFYMRNNPKTEESYPIAERLSNNGFYLPSGVGTTKEEIDYICRTLIEILEYE